jgi:predicted TIM-barrel fold metal-dependent hydrolase
MNVDDLILVSIDDHLIEPPDVFDNHIPARYRDRAPKLIKDDEGIERWVFEGMEVGSSGLNAVASWPKSEWSLDPVGIPEMRPGCYDVHERVRDMNAAGVWASMCFPTMGGFSARAFNDSVDKQLASAVISAYNDWHIDEWCGAYPERFIPLAVMPIWDVDDCVAEMRRVAAKGCRAITFPETPYALGLPSFQSGYWDPLLATASDLGVVMCLHIGLGIRLLQQAPDSSVDAFIVLAAQVSAIAATDLLLGPTLRKFPELRVAMSEGGIGWIPFYLERADRHHFNQTWTGERGVTTPRDLFRQNILACFITDPAGLKLRHDIGIDNIAWECDYPHSDSTWPSPGEQLLPEMGDAGCTDDEIHKITWQNSCRWFDVDPFRTTSRQQTTVGALRRLAVNVDTAIVSRNEWRQRYELAHADEA